MQDAIDVYVDKLFDKLDNLKNRLVIFIESRDDECLGMDQQTRDIYHYAKGYVDAVVELKGKLIADIDDNHNLNVTRWLENYYRNLGDM